MHEYVYCHTVSLCIAKHGQSLRFGFRALVHPIQELPPESNSRELSRKRLRRNKIVVTSSTSALMLDLVK